MHNLLITFPQVYKIGKAVHKNWIQHISFIKHINFLPRKEYLSCLDIQHLLQWWTQALFPQSNSLLPSSNKNSPLNWIQHVLNHNILNNCDPCNSQKQ